jgi:hypothetical protein
MFTITSGWNDYLFYWGHAPTPLSILEYLTIVNYKRTSYIMPIYLPKTTIKKDEINIWKSEYDKILSQSKYYLVKKYLYNSFKKFIEKSNNPFEIPWIRDLHDNSLSWLNKFLSQIKMPETEMEEVLNELEKENHKDLIKYIRKINSISGELIVYNELKKEGNNNIHKIHEFGDWGADGKIYSVKDCESITTKYGYTEDVICGLVYTEGNEILKNYTSVRISNIDDFNDTELSSLLNYFRYKLVNHLIKGDKKLEQGYFYSNEFEEITIKNKITIKFRMEGTPPGTLPTPHNLYFNLVLGNNKSLSIFFRKESYPAIHLFTDHDTFWVGSKWKKEDIEGLKHKISGKIKDTCRKEYLPDVLWINISLHCKFYETYNKDAVIEEFRKLINKEKGLTPRSYLSQHQDFLIIN